MKAPTLFDSLETDSYTDAVQFVRRERRAYTCEIQRCLKIAYWRAAEFVKRMHREGIVNENGEVKR